MSTLTSTRIPTGTYNLDAAHSTIGFVARHAMVTKVRGSFTEFEGSAIVAEDLNESSAKVTIKVDSIDTRNEQRDGHLRGNDFFDIANHPEITFVSTSVVAEDHALEVTGDLTIKGVTKPVTIDVRLPGLRHGSLRQRPHRLRGLGRHQPQGLGRQLERRARGRRRAGLREGHPGVRPLRDQGFLTPDRIAP